MKSSDYIWHFLKAHGVGHVFLVPGGAIMHLVDSLGTSGIPYTTCLHEQAAAYAAAAYSAYNAALGVVLVTAGPGSTNALTGCACAWMESNGVLFLSGNPQRRDLVSAGSCMRSRGPQETPIIAMATPITKYAQQVLDPSTLGLHLTRAIQAATQGRRGPVWLDIPLDVQSSELPPQQMVVDSAQAATVDLSSALETVAAQLAVATRPLLFVGDGARRASVLPLVDQLQIPVLTSWKAMDLIPDDHPLYVGRPGAIGQRAANFAQQTADFILMVGNRLDCLQTAFDYSAFAPQAFVVSVDVDAAELGKLTRPAHLDVCAPAEEFVAGMQRQHITAPGCSDVWRQRCADWRQRYPVVRPEYHQEHSYVNPYALVDVLSDLMTADDIMVPGSSGQSSDTVMQAFRVKMGQRVMNAPGWGAMGTGLPAAIGACLASGQRRTVCINGDGGIQLNLQELATLRRLNLPIKLFISCNDGYGSIRTMQHTHFQGRLVGCDASSGLLLPSLRRVVRAYDLPVVSIVNCRRLREVVQEVLAMDGPVVAVVSVAPDAPTVLRTAAQQQPDGTVAAGRMENLAPFLPADVLEKELQWS